MKYTVHCNECDCPRSYALEDVFYDGPGSYYITCCEVDDEEGFAPNPTWLQISHQLSQEDKLAICARERQRTLDWARQMMEDIIP
jgi:hypothetical protein